MNILVTGGAGFIGSAVVRHIIQNTSDEVCVIDKLTYAGNMDNIKKVQDKIKFEQADICDFEKMKEIFKKYGIKIKIL